jgi:hypothetical protein
MSFYEEAITKAKEKGVDTDTEEFKQKIRDYALEKSSQFISDVKSKKEDVDDNKIFEYIESKTGIPQDIIYPETQTTSQMPKDFIQLAESYDNDYSLADEEKVSLDKREVGVETLKQLDVPEEWIQKKQDELKPEPLYKKENSFEYDINTGEVIGTGTGAKVMSAVLGSKRLPLGLLRVTQDVANEWKSLFGDIDPNTGEVSKDELFSFTSDMIRENEGLIEKLNNGLGFKKGGKGELSYDDAGQLVAELLTLPLSVTRGIRGLNAIREGKIATSMAEGARAGLSTLGEGEDYSEAGTDAFLTAITTGLGLKAVDELEKLWKDPRLLNNIIEGKASPEQAYGVLRKKSGHTDSEIFQAEQAYSEAIGKSMFDFTVEDKTLALLKNTDMGAKFKAEAEYYDKFVLGEVNKLEETITDMFKKQTADGDFDIPALQLKQYSQDSGKLYEETKNILLDHFNDVATINPKQVDTFIESLRKSSLTMDDDKVITDIANTLKSKDVKVEDLLAMKQKLNSLNLQSTRAYKAGEMGDFIDSIAERTIGKEGFAIWKDVNKRYASSKLLEDNNIASLLKDMETQNISLETLSDRILKIPNTGYKTFNSLRQAIGDKEMQKVEKAIIGRIVNNKELSIPDMFASLKQFEGSFSTTQGRRLLAELDRASGMVSDTKAIELLKGAFSQPRSSTGWSDNLISKARYTIIGKIWESVARRLPSGEPERVMYTVADIIKNNPNTFKIKSVDKKTATRIFEEEQEALKQSIIRLKEKGKAKTAEENKKLAELMKQQRDAKIPMKYSEKLEFEKPKEVEDIIDAEIIQYKLNPPERGLATTDTVYTDSSGRASKDYTQLEKENMIQENVPESVAKKKSINDNKRRWDKRKEDMSKYKQKQIEYKEQKEIDTGSESYAKEMEEYEASLKKDTRFKPKTMTIGNVTINKTDFDNIQRYQNIRKWNRNNPTKKKKISDKIQESYNKHRDIADDLLDLDFQEGKSLPLF